MTCDCHVFRATPDSKSVSIYSGAQRVKRLILLRHAKSSWDAPVSRDFDRPLSKRGHKAGKVMGRYLKAEKISWDVALVSPAARTLATVDRLELGYGAPCYALQDERLYMASTHQLLYIVRGFDDMFRSA
ncbi:MAG: histidine phosphatase family protein, partial [Pseudomonadota bacterium]